MASFAIFHFVVALVGAIETVPPLTESSQGKHYLRDKSPPRGNLAFDPLYPEPQKTSAWEDDFVKDDRSDGGRWDTQMLYDTIRTTRAHQVQKVKDALIAEKVAEENLAKAKAKAKENEAALEKAAALTQKQAESTAKDAVAVNQEEAALEAVQANLSKVQQAVTTAKGEVSSAKAKLNKAKEVEAKKKEELKTKLEKQQKKAHSKQEELEEKLNQVQNHLDELADKADKEEDDHDAANAQYEAAVADEKKTAAALERAAERLQRWRNGDKSVEEGLKVDPGERPRSGAATVTSSALVATCVVAALARF